jgi:hypothetical protein
MRLHDLSLLKGLGGLGHKAAIVGVVEEQAIRETVPECNCINTRLFFANVKYVCLAIF